MKARFIGKYTFGWFWRGWFPCVAGPDPECKLQLEQPAPGQARHQVRFHFAAFERDGCVAFQAANGRFLRFDLEHSRSVEADARTLADARWFQPGVLDTEARESPWVTADGSRIVSAFPNYFLGPLAVTPYHPERLHGQRAPLRQNFHTWRVECVTPSLEILYERGSAKGLDLQRLDLSGEDLSGMDLRQTRLEFASLRGARLDGANLSQAELCDTDLTGATLQCADLTDTKLVEKELQQVELTEADLTRAVFRGSRLTQCRLAGAVLHGTDFGGARFEDTDLGDRPSFGRSMETRTRFVDAVLPHRILGRDWGYLDLSSVQFTNAEPIDGRVDLAGLRARHVRLVRVNLSRFDLSESDLSGADLTGARLDGALLEKAILEQANLSRTRLRGAVCREVVFDSARLYATNLTDIDFKSCTFCGAYGGTTGEERVAFFTGSLLTNTDFTKARLDEADLTGVVMDSCSFAEARLEGAKLGLSFFGDTVFDGARLAGAGFEGSCLVRASLRNAQVPATDKLRSASFVEAFLHGADFTGTRLDGVNLRGAVVTFNSEDLELEVWIPPAPGEPDIKIPFIHGATVLDPKSTGQDTLCPDGSVGPCGRDNLETPDPPDCWRYDRPRATAHVREIERLLDAGESVHDNDHEIGEDRRDN